MHIQVLIPTEVLIDEEATKVVAEAENGSFCLLPHHVDFVAALAPGILTFADRQGRAQVLAVDRGILVKCGDNVKVSVLNAVRGASLAELHRSVAMHFRRLDADQESARSALARLEAGALRRFVELEESTRGR